MYYEVKRKTRIVFGISNIIMLLIFSLIAYFGIYNDQLSMPVVVGLLFATVLVVNFITRNFEINLENQIIYAMVKHKQIAVAEIKQIKHYKTDYDSHFKKKEIYEIEICIFDRNLEKRNYTIYECINIRNKTEIGEYVYVTFNGTEKMIGVIPDLMLSMINEAQEVIDFYRLKMPVKFLNIERFRGLVIRGRNS